jgi:hypothetical protein
MVVTPILACTLCGRSAHLPANLTHLVSDHTRETFKPSTSHGGKDGDKRGLRYLELIFDPDPSGSTYLSYLAYMLCRGDNYVRCLLDRHHLGLFSHADWLRLITHVGFEVISPLINHEDDEPNTGTLFVGNKPE